MRARAASCSVLAVGLGFACGAPPRAVPTPTRACVLDGLGVSFELPADWEVVPGADAVFAGPAHNSSVYTTLAVQAIATGEGALSESLAGIVARLVDEPRFALLYREPAVFASRAAVRYGLMVEANETLFVRHAALIDGDNIRIDLSFGAVPELALMGYSVFEDALSSLTLFIPAAFALGG